MRRGGAHRRARCVCARARDRAAVHAVRVGDAARRAVSGRIPHGSPGYPPSRDHRVAAHLHRILSAPLPNGPGIWTSLRSGRRVRRQWTLLEGEGAMGSLRPSPRLAAAAGALVLIAVALGSSGAAATSRAHVASDATTTPIKHVIVIVGENHTFDNVYATYTPRHGQRIMNLRTEGIVKRNGTPGANV